MNEVSIIINGVRYDAVEATKKELNDFCFIACHSCDLDKKCNKHDAYELCRNVLGTYTYFKKSKKSLKDETTISKNSAGSRKNRKCN